MKEETVHRINCQNEGVLVSLELIYNVVRH